MVINRLVSTCALVVCLASIFHFCATTATPQYFRDPVVLSIAPDIVSCDDPDDPDNVEDVLITGICFQGDVTAAYLTLNPDGTGTQIPLTTVVNIGANLVTATVPLDQLTERDTSYYVFVVRGRDERRSTAYPNPLGYDVTFTCTSSAAVSDPPLLTSCKVVRTGAGRFALRVDGTQFRVNESIVLINDVPCRKNKYPQRYINPADNTTTRIVCHDDLKRLLPATVTVRFADGVISANSLVCDK